MSLEEQVREFRRGVVDLFPEEELKALKRDLTAAKKNAGFNC